MAPLHNPHEGRFSFLTKNLVESGSGALEEKYGVGGHFTVDSIAPPGDGSSETRVVGVQFEYTAPYLSKADLPGKSPVDQHADLVAPDDL
jgi:hypothetical protein